MRPVARSAWPKATCRTAGTPDDALVRDFDAHLARLHDSTNCSALAIADVSLQRSEPSPFFLCTCSERPAPVTARQISVHANGLKLGLGNAMMYLTRALVLATVSGRTLVLRNYQAFYWLQSDDNRTSLDAGELLAFSRCQSLFHEGAAFRDVVPVESLENGLTSGPGNMRQRGLLARLCRCRHDFCPGLYALPIGFEKLPLSWLWHRAARALLPALSAVDNLHCGAPVAALDDSEARARRLRRRLGLAAAHEEVAIVRFRRGIVSRSESSRSAVWPLFTGHRSRPLIAVHLRAGDACHDVGQHRPPCVTSLLPTLRRLALANLTSGQVLLVTDSAAAVNQLLSSFDSDDSAIAEGLGGVGEWTIVIPRDVAYSAYDSHELIERRAVNRRAVLREFVLSLHKSSPNVHSKQSMQLKLN